jgi:hypothetical protein
MATHLVVLYAFHDFRPYHPVHYRAMRYGGEMTKSFIKRLLKKLGLRFLCFFLTGSRFCSARNDKL